MSIGFLSEKWENNRAGNTASNLRQPLTTLDNDYNESLSTTCYPFRN